MGKESTGAESAAALAETGDIGLGAEPLGRESIDSSGGMEAEGRFAVVSFSSMTAVGISGGGGSSNLGAGAKVDGGVEGVDGFAASG